MASCVDDNAPYIAADNLSLKKIILEGSGKLTLAT